VNQAALSGSLVEKKAKRYTPAGLPVLEIRLAHETQVLEAGIPRTVQFEVKAKAVGEVAERLEKIALDRRLVIQGFLAPAKLHSNQINFHLTNFELE
jgi:primosomal replication protein N